MGGLWGFRTRPDSEPLQFGVSLRVSVSRVSGILKNSSKGSFQGSIRV